MATNEIRDDALDALLSREFDGPVIDDGFSARVMGALPPRRPWTTWVLPTAAVVGGAFAWAALAPSPLWREVATEMAAGSSTGAALAFIALLLGLGVLGVAWALEESF